MPRRTPLEKLFHFLDGKPLWWAWVLPVAVPLLLAHGVPWWYRDAAIPEKLPAGAIMPDGRVDVGVMTMHFREAAEQGEALGMKMILPQLAPHAFLLFFGMASILTIRRWMGYGIQTGISCPRCGAPMHSRVAKRGAHAGDGFYGCTRYPSCRGKRDITTLQAL